MGRLSIFTTGVLLILGLVVSGCSADSIVGPTETTIVDSTYGQGGDGHNNVDNDGDGHNNVDNDGDGHNNKNQGDGHNN
jgi:hypothetical protein